jgi:hypothetical protein
MSKVSLRALVLITLSAIPVTAAAGNCSQNALNGSYGFVTTVRVVATNPKDPVERQRVVGIVQYDGTGNLKFTGSRVGTKGVDQFFLHGTYTINPECLGKATLLNNKDQQSDMWRFVIVKGGATVLTVSDASPNLKPFAQEKQ